MTSAKLAAAALAVACLAAAGPAAAQSAPPVGFWATDDGSERLLVSDNGHCMFTNGQGQVFSSGRCSWNASSRGGILTVMSEQNYRPAPIYYNVVWINPLTISVQGDVFRKRAG